MNSFSPSLTPSTRPYASISTTDSREESSRSRSARCHARCQLRLQTAAHRDEQTCGILQPLCLSPDIAEASLLIQPLAVEHLQNTDVAFVIALVCQRQALLSNCNGL